MTYSKLSPKELGTVEAILIGFNKHQLPRLLEIQERVNHGEMLNEFELVFLEETLQEVQDTEYFADRHPEYQKLVAEVASLYECITHKARANQEGS
ncbi:hypothetical protein [Marinagarivorans cellulosilyticus]|uniref:Uncharacterized protein n=1 Tax=Marinagarivorans cellulosilyticus TaxID=2721545 RepID=A0AAN1WKR1_9GAMM|nr:hypothetical protein [Marinagarivorans cellulosilyticus]BCD99403.1 hypothetical protein MARGE09_P3605 [Marinagarivorans cellulosilyticus]